MTAQRLANPDIADVAGAHAMPRRSGELVFHDEWERRAFAIAVSLAQQGQIQWRDFQQELIASVAAAERGDPGNPGRGYYESWLVSLEALLRSKGLVGDEDPSHHSIPFNHGLRS